MTTLRTAAQQALEALKAWEELVDRKSPVDREPWPLRWNSDGNILVTLGKKHCENLLVGREHRAAITALRAALEQPEHEPVAWMVYTLDGQSVCVTDNPSEVTEQHRALPLYTHPPRREWQGLTEEEIWQLYYDGKVPEGDRCDRVDFARAIEAVLRGRNG